MLVSESRQRVEEDEMYRVLPQLLAAEHIAELHREAERQRLLRELRDGRDGRDQPPRRRRTVRERLSFRPARPAGA
jgi:hypothetical protein